MRAPQREIRCRPLAEQVICVALCAVTYVFASPRFVLAGQVREDRQALHAQYRGDLEKLASKHEQAGLAEPAAILREWLPPENPRQLYAYLPASGIPEDLTSLPAKDLQPWQAEFVALRKQQAEALLELARRALGEQHISLAFELVREACREDPHHAEARRMLGFERYRDDGWYRPFAIRRLKRGQIWHDRFGWILKSHVKRYEQGQRYYQGRWISAAEEAQRRTDIRSGWLVETENYAIRTNAGLEEGVQLAKRLERLHDVWQQVFIGYFASTEALEEVFSGQRAFRPLEPRHRVVYFREREDYIRHLRPAQPQIEMTLGIYFDDQRTAFFYADAEDLQTTIHHEGTHQLFHESRPVAARIGRRQNFWIIEGIACYMESLRFAGDVAILGGDEVGRLPAARHRLNQGEFYLPFARMTRLGMRDLQQHPRIRALYSQAAGQTAFLMHFDEGKYRDGLIEYLSTVYRGQDRPETLADVLQVSWDRLDEEYRQFLLSPAKKPAPVPQE